ncbi:hypothetical protein [Nostoc punctiforme]|uniref:hypothetical protein n=1 Tax=Nostoc punctiforme TaxID=272131 RepID=UPI001427BE86|nr:hypothetical protein [Nostoc punctiforme]
MLTGAGCAVPDKFCNRFGDCQREEVRVRGRERDIRHRTLGRYALLGSPGDNGSPEPNR